MGAGDERVFGHDDPPGNMHPGIIHTWVEGGRERVSRLIPPTGLLSPVNDARRVDRKGNECTHGLRQQS